MKTLYSILLLLLISILSYSQAPEAFSYQALIRNGSGDILANSQVAVQISFLQDSESGSAVYVETFNPTTTQYGLIALKLGKGSVQSGTFNAIDWGAHAYYVKIEIDPNNGTDYTHMGTSQLLSVPYALYTKSAENAFSGDYNDLSNAPTVVSAFTNDAGYLTTFTETDPVFGAHAANVITSTNITNWTSAYGWGDHASAGYLTSYTETDPVFGAHAANGITSGNISNWNTAFGWGNHASEGYLKSFTETDPVFGAHAANGITAPDITNWNTAFGWGDHNAEGYIDDGNTNWDNSYGFITDGNTNWNNTYGFITAGSTITGLIRSSATGDSWINGGDVGIGTSSPDARLHVQYGSVQFDPWAGSDSYAQFSSIGGGYVQLYLNDGTVNAVAIRSNGGSWFRGGMVDIGDGTNNWATGVGDLYVQDVLEVDGTIYSAGYVNTSDARWKKDIVPVDDALNKILQLNGVNFNWKSDEYPEEGFSEDRQIGFIAQEVEQILPELVHSDQNNYKGVSYDKITAVLVEAIKEQQQMIEELKQEVEKLINQQLVVTTQ